MELMDWNRYSLQSATKSRTGNEQLLVVVFFKVCLKIINKEGCAIWNLFPELFIFTVSIEEVTQEGLMFDHSEERAFLSFPERRTVWWGFLTGSDN